MNTSVESTQSSSPASMQQLRDDLNRRLAKLTDENWAKDLEIQNLRRLHESEENVSMRIKAECSLLQSKLHEAVSRQAELEELLESKDAEVDTVREETSRILREENESHEEELSLLKETNTTLRGQLTELRTTYEREFEEYAAREASQAENIKTLEANCATQAKQIEQGNLLVASFNDALEKGAEELKAAKEQADQSLKAVQELMQKNAQQAESFRAREGQLAGELTKLRSDLAKAEKSLRDADETIPQLRQALELAKNQHATELRNFEEAAGRSIAELQTSMEAEFQAQFEVVAAENRKFRQMLEVRDTQMEVDRQNLKQWQEQLNFFDQHLRQAKEALKREKAEILKLAKQLTGELQLARSHAFRDYVQLAEGEIAKVQTQIDATSTLSPMRAKLEERLQQLGEHRDSLKASLASAQQQIEDRIQALSAIIKNSSLP